MKRVTLATTYVSIHATAIDDIRYCVYVYLFICVSVYLLRIISSSEANAHRGDYSIGRNLSPVPYPSVVFNIFKRHLF